MLPAPLWLALVRAMLVVDDGTRITLLSLHGEGKEEVASPQKRKPTPPRCARQPLPKEGAEVGWGKRYPRHKAFPAWGRWRAKRADRVLAV